MIVRDKIFGNFEFCSTRIFYSGRYIWLTKTFHLQQVGNTSPRPGARCSHNWRVSTRRSRPRWGWSTDSPQRAWSPCLTSSPATQEETILTRNFPIGEDGWVAWLAFSGLTENNYLYHFRETSFTVIKDVVHCMIVRRTTKMSLHLKKAILSSSWPRRPRTITGWRASWSQPQTSEAYFPPRLSTCWLPDHPPCPEMRSDSLVVTQPASPGQVWWGSGESLLEPSCPALPVWRSSSLEIAQHSRIPGNRTLRPPLASQRILIVKLSATVTSGLIWENSIVTNTTNVQTRPKIEISALYLNFNCD